MPFLDDLKERYQSDRKQGLMVSAEFLLDVIEEIERLTAELAAAKGLLLRSANHILRWNEKYGEHNPQWLPPAGGAIIREGVDEFLSRGEKSNAANLRL